MKMARQSGEKVINKTRSELILNPINIESVGVWRLCKISLTLFQVITIGGS